jgi:C4-dicarboxylate-specific signal transduction histidine kinase
MAGSLTDVTPRRHAEEEARRRQAEVAHAQRLSTLGEMAAGLAHELNQPLAAIVSYARGCVRRLRGGDARHEDLVHPIEEVAKQALRAGAVLQRYRAFVRSGTLRREPVRINQLARDAADFVAPSAAEQGISVRLKLAANLPEVIVDGVQIEQVLLNLIRNAIEAMHGCATRELSIHTRVVGEGVEVAVEDVGTGISAEVGDRIFETFFTTKSEGLGMGLSISRSIIEAHGGRLWSTANPGGGTVFRFTVPLRPPEGEIADGDRVSAGIATPPATEFPSPAQLKNQN